MKITALNNQGKGICYIDNKITFVKDTLVNDDVNVTITKRRSKYNEGIVLDNPHKSFCPYFKECSGCNLSIMSYEDTLIFKKNTLESIMLKFGNIKKDIPVIASLKCLHYRNKITLKVQNDMVGYYKEDSHNLLNINKCFLAKEEINKFIPYIKDFNIHNGEVVIRCNYNNELLINFITEDPITLIDIKELKIVGILHNGKKLYGDDKFMELINNRYFQVSYDSFFQINEEVISIILNDMKEYIKEEDNILDLYSGVGLLGISLVNKKNTLYGAETILNATLNARLNAKINGITNAFYLCGDVALNVDKIDTLIDTLIIDPPRAGLDKKTLTFILNKGYSKIIYLACDPITMARDLKEMQSKYTIVMLKGYDMFPFTAKVETLAILEYKNML